MKKLTMIVLATGVIALAALFAVVAFGPGSGGTASATPSTQTPSFSVAAGGPSLFAAADILDTPAAVGIPAASLGLAGGDDIDALSYGSDYVDYATNVFFSVAPGAAGLLASAVAVEAAIIPPEPEGDEFKPTIPFPALPAAVGSNLQELDEDGNSAATFGLVVGDDVDALEDSPTSFVDTNSDTIPELPVYFSLATFSPTLAGILAGPEDILTSVGGGVPTVFIAGAAMTLVAGDDIDAICLDFAPGTVIFSLTPASPSLPGLSAPSPASGANLFHYTPPGLPMLWATAANLGLKTADDVDAAKCLLDVPVGGIADFPDVDGSPLSASDTSGGSSFPLAAVAGGLAALGLLAAGGVYARRRFVRS